jgi:hypothetical protein
VSNEPTITAEGILVIPANLPAGTVITVTITIGGAEKAAEKQVAVEKPRHMGMTSRAINGGER